jgi:malate dehydrogenase (oxaloacetate-decarboxylating)
MLMAGVHALASLSPALTNPEASLLPDLADVRAVSVDVAAAVVRQAVADGTAQDEATIKIVQGKEGQSLEDYIRVSGSWRGGRGRRAPGTKRDAPTRVAAG